MGKKKSKRYGISLDYRIYKDGNEIMLFYVATLNRTTKLMPSNFHQAALVQAVVMEDINEPTKTVLLDTI